MLIEAAKGGHTNVVNLLLDWPNNMMSPSSASLTQLSPPPLVDVIEVYTASVTADSHHNFFLVTAESPGSHTRLNEHCATPRP
jgi:hypothetical protein